MSRVGSQAEYARHRGVSKKTVTVWKQQGRLVLADGLVDFDASDRALAEAGRPAATVTVERLPKVTHDPGTPQEIAEAAVYDKGDAPHTQAEAERIKENYLALLRQLEYDQKSGAVVPVTEIARIVGDGYASVRTRLMAIPAEQAPKLHRLKTVAEVQAALLEIITKALKELSSVGVAGAPVAR